ncbi:MULTISPECIES: ATP-binding protein [unclassified Pseudodesulfovibrio]|uniref:ATP-binding protein n=1 Tax=unclassified Pseudodesulfovibrio TaxID=2661612 RepID=UPI000FEBB2DA|nr:MULTISPECIES: ATP-binding protein [unclassified Pseudodesulfovibrio]MCJ2164550.1 ATP-binding protein [Pseudodesulfovibrio sp. S3-i]RWU04748.1 HAMP domain-containing protein [Pseudodesulfovibrio sp. S3]
MIEKNVTPLGRKIVAATLGITLLALALSFLLNIIPTVYSYRRGAVERALSTADLMAVSLGPSVDFHDPAAAQENLATLSLIPVVTGAAVFLNDGTLFASYGKPPVLPVSGEFGVSTTLTALTVVTPIQAEQPGNALVITVSMGEQGALLQGYLFSGAIILFGVFIFCFKLAGVIRRKLGDPLHELTSVVHNISRSRDYSRRVNHESNDELGVLVTEFNAMLKRIEDRDAELSRYRESLEQRVEERTLQLKANQLELLQNNRRLFMEIRKRAQSEMIREEVERINRHDLKSGLSLVIGYPELLLKEGGLNARQEKLIKRVRAAGYRMLDMIRNHLDMFKMEKGVYSLNRLPIDLVQTLCDLEEEFNPQLTSSGVKLVIELDGRDVVGDEQFIISGEGPLMRTMCRNLIQNAIEASAPGDSVIVSMEQDERKHLTVSNPAVVPQEIRERFFEKYVTAGKENGTGLGTYFAALIVKTHGADITMKTSDESGTTLRVSFRGRAGDSALKFHPLPPTDSHDSPR